jgi:hypothetical protein
LPGTRRRGRRRRLLLARRPQAVCEALQRLRGRVGRAADSDGFELDAAHAMADPAVACADVHALAVRSRGASRRGISVSCVISIIRRSVSSRRVCEPGALLVHPRVLRRPARPQRRPADRVPTRRLRRPGERGGLRRPPRQAALAERDRRPRHPKRPGAPYRVVPRAPAGLAGVVAVTVSRRAPLPSDGAWSFAVCFVASHLSYCTPPRARACHSAGPARGSDPAMSS